MEPKDHQDKKSPNRLRREERMQNLTNAMQDPKNCLFSLIGLLKLEKRGSYICAFMIQNKNEGEYERALVYGDFYTERYRVGLFCVERDCIGEMDGSNMDSAIPVLNFAGEEVIECTVIDTSKIKPKERALMEANYAAAITAIESMD